MGLGKTKRSRLIRRFLLNAVKAGNQQIVRDALPMRYFESSLEGIHT